MAVWLAAPDETVSWEEAQQFDSHPLTIKLGGAPAWLLDPAGVAPPDTQCGQCQGPLALVSQVHAPAAHIDGRVLYLFGCRSGRCASSWKAFRCQSSSGTETDAPPPSSSRCGAVASTFVGAEFDEFDDFEEPVNAETFKGDDFDGVDPPPHNVELAATVSPPFVGEGAEEQVEEAEEEEGADVLDGCTAAAISEDLPSVVSSSSSRLCNVVDVANGTSRTTRPAHSLTPLKPICLDVFLEPEGVSRAEEKELQQIRKQVKNLAMDDAPGEEYEEDADKVFSRFSKRLGKYPKQCLRWSLGGAPLPIQQRRPPPGSGLPGAPAVPRCPACGAARQFELQVLPTVIYYLQNYWRGWTTDDAEDAEAPPPECGLSFGSVYLYTCTAHCTRDRYTLEWLHVQDEV